VEVTYLYNLDSDPHANSEAYKGDVVIPAKFDYMGVTRNVTKIGDETEVTDLTITAGIWVSGGCNMANYAFIQCKNLKSLTVSGYISSWGRKTFEGCDNLKTIVLTNKKQYIRAPKEEDATFSTETYENAILYVPKGQLNLYKEDENWRKFAHIVEDDANGIGEVEIRKNGENDKANFTYDLSGRRVSLSHKGIHVQQGRKVAR